MGSTFSFLQRVCKHTLWLVVPLLLLVACAQEMTAPEATATLLPLPQATAAASMAGTATPAATRATAAPGAATAAGYTTFLPLAVASAPARRPRPTPTPAPAPTPAPTPTPIFPIYEGPPLPRDEIGVQILLHGTDLDTIFQHLRTLEAGWLKAQISWKLYEPGEDRYDEVLLMELDQVVSRANNEGIKVLLSVAKAPDWTRPTNEMDGPPSDFDHYRDFMAFLATRYQGRVAAYELWNEPNLQREWNGMKLDAGELVRLIEDGAAGVRAADPSALLVSAAPATTGINDGVIAIDDRVYLRAMFAHGVGNVVDAVGAHPYSWANPPDASAAAPDPVAPTHNNHPSFFFADTLRDYRAIVDEAGYPELPLWVTEFGWGSFHGLGSEPPPGAEFMGYVDEWQQAVYTLRAYELAHERPNIGPLFLWNLNFAPTLGPEFVESGYSILRPDGSPRPVYYALGTIPKQ